MMKQSTRFMIMLACVVVVSSVCSAEEKIIAKSTNQWVSLGMPCAVAEANIYAFGGKQCQMLWPSGTVYALKSGVLMAVVGDGNKTNAAVARIFVCHCPPAVVTNWPEYSRYELISKPIPESRRRIEEGNYWYWRRLSDGEKKSVDTFLRSRGVEKYEITRFFRGGTDKYYVDIYKPGETNKFSVQIDVTGTGLKIYAPEERKLIDWIAKEAQAGRGE